jgi:hypothetical protein
MEKLTGWCVLAFIPDEEEKSIALQRGKDQS